MREIVYSKTFLTSPPQYRARNPVFGRPPHYEPSYRGQCRKNISGVIISGTRESACSLAVVHILFPASYLMKAIRGELAGKPREEISQALSPRLRRVSRCKRKDRLLNAVNLPIESTDWRSAGNLTLLCAMYRSRRTVVNMLIGLCSFWHVRSLHAGRHPGRWRTTCQWCWPQTCSSSSQSDT